VPELQVEEVLPARRILDHELRGTPTTTPEMGVSEAASDDRGYDQMVSLPPAAGQSQARMCTGVSISCAQRLSDGAP